MVLSRYELLNEPRKTFDKILDFLGLDRFDAGADIDNLKAYNSKNSTAKAPLSPRTIQKLEEFYRSSNQKSCLLMGKNKDCILD
jgi:hypothetical protein